MTQPKPSSTVLHKDLAHPCSDCGARDMTVCEALTVEEQNRMAAIAHTKRFDVGETVFAEGEPSDFVFNVTGGMLKLFKTLPDGRRQVVGFIGVGDFLGLAIRDHYAYGAEAITPILLCKFQRLKLEALLDEIPRLQRRLFALASTELAAAQDQMLLLGRKSAKEKICSFLILMSERSARRCLSPNPVYLPMPRSDIADYLGLTIETVSRTITVLKNSGAIRLLEGNKVFIADLDELKRLTGTA